MVHQPTQRRARLKGLTYYAILFLVIASFSIAIVYFFHPTKNVDSQDSAEENRTETELESTAEENPDNRGEGESLDLENVVETWLADFSGSAGIFIQDLDENTVLVDYNSDKYFSTASLYKLFVVYEGYSRIERGELDPDELIANGQTLSTCLDLAIRESNSACAETIWQLIGHDELDEIVRETYGIKNTFVSSLQSTPRDIATIMELFYKHADFSEETWQKIADSMLNQPITTYNWRQGLPSGFSVANVYNKVGWEHSGVGDLWLIYNDASIVSFDELDRHFLVVVMTENSTVVEISDLGRQIENVILEFYQ